MVIPLTYLEQDQSAAVVWLASSPDMEKRLADLGFEPDEIITCVIKGKKGGMSAYLVKHAVIALRPCDASGILVRTQ